MEDGEEGRREPMSHDGGRKRRRNAASRIDYNCPSLLSLAALVLLSFVSGGACAHGGAGGGKAEEQGRRRKRRRSRAKQASITCLLFFELAPSSPCYSPIAAVPPPTAMAQLALIVVCTG